MNRYGQLYRSVILPAYDRLLKGRRTTQFWRQAEASQWWTLEQLQEKQLGDLRAMLLYAFQHCEYYRTHWKQRGLDPVRLRSLSDFDSWPVLHREDVRRNRIAMQSSAIRDRLTKSTGGSTGEPLVFDLDHESNQRRTAMTYRGYDWAGGGPGARRLLIWGVDLKPASWMRRAKVAMHHWVDQEKIMNCFSMSQESMPMHFDDMQRFRPEVIIAYTNPLYEFARFLKETSRKPTGIRSLIVGAEKIYPFQRKTIEEVFDAPVFETYGSREFMLIGAECDRHRGMHLSMENLLVEILDEDGKATSAGNEGNVVITDLFNRGMPFIRYRNGDRAIAGFEKCDCGRGLPLLKQVVGRQLDVIRTVSGRVIPGEFFPHFFKDYPSVRRFQVEQSSLEQLEVRVVLDHSSPLAPAPTICDTLSQALGGEIELKWTKVDDIALTKSGKLQVVVNRLVAKS